MPSRSEFERANTRRRILREWWEASPGISAEGLAVRLAEARPDLLVAARTIRRDIAGFAEGLPDDSPNTADTDTGGHGSPAVRRVEAAEDWTREALAKLPEGRMLAEALTATRIASARTAAELVDSAGAVGALAVMERQLAGVFDAVLAALGVDATRKPTLAELFPDKPESGRDWLARHAEAAGRASED